MGQGPIIAAGPEDTMRRPLLALLALVAFAAPAAAEPEATAEPPLPDVQTVTDKLDDLYRSTASEGRMTMEVTTKHYARTLEMDVWTVGEDLALVVIRSPAREAGTATLRTDEGLWNYAPRADRLMRIPSGLLSESWMGSHFTNDDLMRETSWDDDYETTLAWGTDDGTRRLVATMVPKPEAPVVYTKIVQILDAESWLPVRADYYDKDRVVRKIHFKATRDLGGRTLPTVMEVVPTDEPGELTRVTYVRMRFDVPVDKALFTPRGLRQVARTR
jgi:outer membrane lipoprotein-sorting protein